MPVCSSNYDATERTSIGAGVPSVVMVHGRTLGAAEQAVRATGMARVTSFDQIGVVVAVASKRQVEAARSQPGDTYVEGNQRLAYTTRRPTWRRVAWRPLSGSTAATAAGSTVLVSASV